VGQGQVFERAPRILNASDRIALEAALQLKEQGPAAGVEVTVALLGRPQDERVLREALAVGAGSAHHLTTSEVDAGDSFSHATYFGSFLQKIGPVDLILCGHTSEDGIPSQIGPRLAEILSIPQRTQVQEVRWDQERLMVRQIPTLPLFPLASEGSASSEPAPFPTPGLLTLVDGVYQPRIPNAIRIMKSARIPINQWDIMSLEPCSPAVQVRRFFIQEASEN
jgi:electron transfer flavoprotein beta subunit